MASQMGSIRRSRPTRAWIWWSRWLAGTLRAEPATRITRKADAAPRWSFLCRGCECPISFARARSPRCDGLRAEDAVLSCLLCAVEGGIGELEEAGGGGSVLGVRADAD